MKKIASVLVCFSLGFAFVSCMAKPKCAPCKPQCAPCAPKKNCGPRDECAHNDIRE